MCHKIYWNSEVQVSFLAKISSFVLLFLHLYHYNKRDTAAI
jgi:hypothetical protein